MDIWEYKVTRMHIEPGKGFVINEPQLQYLGSQGWELVNIVLVESRSKPAVGHLVDGALITSMCDFVFKRRR